MRRPSGMNREVYALLYSDSKLRCAIYWAGVLLSSEKSSFQPSGFSRPHGHWHGIPTASRETRKTTCSLLEVDGIYKPKQICKFTLSCIRSPLLATFTLQDGLTLSHWCRVADAGKDYPFAQFNKTVDVPTYTDKEYAVRSNLLLYCLHESVLAVLMLQKHLTEDSWSQEETDHLMQLCLHFDLRFIVIQDRYDTTRFPVS